VEKYREAFKSSFYRSLKEKGRNLFTFSPDAEFRILLFPSFIEDQTKPLGPIGWAMLNLFIPPLALIPHSIEYDYQVEYLLKNNQDKIILDASLSGTVEGTYAGWYIGLDVAQKKLIEKETEFIAENCATLVINDICQQFSSIIQSLREKEKAKKEVAQIQKEKKRIADENKRLAMKKIQKEKTKQWIAIKKQAELALEINDFKKAVAIIEEARSLGVGGSDAEQMLKDIFRTPEWGAIKPKISIQKFDVSSNLDPSVGDFLYESLIVELTDSQRFTIVDWEELDRLLNYIAQSQPNLSFEDAKMHAMNQLGVNQLFVGSAYKIGSKIYVTVKALNLDLTVDTTYKDTAKTMDDLEACIARIADKFVFANNQ